MRVCKKLVLEYIGRKQKKLKEYSIEYRKSISEEGKQIKKEYIKESLKQYRGKSFNKVLKKRKQKDKFKNVEVLQ